MTDLPSRNEIEDFLFHEAALLDEWRLREWLELLTEDAAYMVPPNDDLDADHRTTLFTIADDAERIRQRVIRLTDVNCHAEYPPSRTRRLIGNVRILSAEGSLLRVSSNFVCYRYRRHERVREYTGRTLHQLRTGPDGLRIRERRVMLDRHELGALGSVSFIL